MFDIRSTWATAPRLPTLFMLLVAIALQGAVRQLSNKEMAPITREGLAWINDLGGGQDFRGYYNNPIDSMEALGVQLSEGWHSAPMDFHDSGHRIRFFVQGGRILKQDYEFREVNLCEEGDRNCRRGFR